VGAVAPSSTPFGDEPTQFTKGERWSYEASKTCDSMRAVPRAKASANAVDETSSNTVSPSVSHRRYSI
jgi:hypothetical protein